MRRGHHADLLSLVGAWSSAAYSMPRSRVAVGLERAHAECCGQGEGLPVVGMATTCPCPAPARSEGTPCREASQVWYGFQGSELRHRTSRARARGHQSLPEALHQTHDQPGQQDKEKKHHCYRCGDPDPEFFPSCRIPCQCCDTKRFRHRVVAAEILHQPAQVVRDGGMLRHDIGGFTGISSKVKQQVAVMIQADFDQGFKPVRVVASLCQLQFPLAFPYTGEAMYLRCMRRAQGKIIKRGRLALAGSTQYRAEILPVNHAVCGHRIPASVAKVGNQSIIVTTWWFALPGEYAQASAPMPAPDGRLQKW